MLFSSYEFILVFLPIALAGYYGLRLVARKPITLVWLIGASLVFYAVWDPWNLLVLFSSIAFNFVCGTRISDLARRGRPTRALLVVGIGFNLGLLAYFKYSGFLATNINALLGTDIPVLELALPLAISFFTFQEIAYLVDSSRGETVGYRFREYMLMVTFFPHLIAGPIVNHRILMKQFMSRAEVTASEQTFALGLSLFVVGLAKKVLLADTMAPRADQLFGSVAQGTTPTFLEAWIGSLAYSLQLYFDFSGYSDMAIGLGLLFGFRLPLNFDSPYKATSIVDFWRRWHMTLSAFLRDYLYVALGGGRRGEPRRYVNLLATMLLGGLWHGAGWTFVVWGAIHGVALAVCHFWRRLFGPPPESGGSWTGRVAARALTLLVVVFGWVVFRADSLATAGAITGSMVGLNGFGLDVHAERHLATLETLALLAVLTSVALFAPNSQELLRYDPDRPAETEHTWTTRLASYPLHGAALGCLFVVTLTQMSAVQAFLYFQF